MLAEYYRKKPVEIKAIQWTGENLDEAKAFLGEDFICEWTNDKRIGIRTKEGNMTGSLGDYLIRGVKGEHYACKSDIFDMTYELVED